MILVVTIIFRNGLPLHTAYKFYRVSSHISNWDKDFIEIRM